MGFVVMGKCPNCGANYLLRTPHSRCSWCGKVTCKKCLPVWIGWFEVKISVETSDRELARGVSEVEERYDRIGFCSKACSREFWQRVMDYPLDDIGTDVSHFISNMRRLFYAAILQVLGRSSNPDFPAIAKVENAMRIETKKAKAIRMGIRDDGTISEEYNFPPAKQFNNLAYSALARNMEKCGRPLDEMVSDGRMKAFLKGFNKEIIEKRRCQCSCGCQRELVEGDLQDCCEHCNEYCSDYNGGV